MKSVSRMMDGRMIRQRKEDEMSVKTVEIQPVTEKQFHEIDYLVMRQAFAVQNDLGRFYDEAIYQNELARCCLAVGLDSVETEVPITVSHDDFTKTYFMDLLINRSVIYELKTVRAFNGIHRRQLLNYLLLCQLYHGKLINFRSPAVTHEFTSTSLDRKQRNLYELKLSDWCACDAESAQLKSIVEDLLADWGVFLEASLYQDAVVHFLGGSEKVESHIDVLQKNIVLGQQRVHMLNEQTAFFITAVKHQPSYRSYLENLLLHTHIQSIQWINFNNHDVEFSTLT